MVLAQASCHPPSQHAEESVLVAYPVFVSLSAKLNHCSTLVAAMILTPSMEPTKVEPQSRWIQATENRLTRNNNGNKRTLESSDKNAC
jgi:glutamate-1-semialdehyde aminotransferase